jgi:threonine synthase
VKAAQKFKTVGVPMVCLSTAHPAKFGETVAAAIGKPPQVPETLAGIIDKPSRCEMMDAEKNQIQDFITKKALIIEAAQE